MQTKLTLRLDDALIQRAKLLSKKSGKSVSQMVAVYFAMLDETRSISIPKITPIVRSLKGSLDNPDISEDDYKKYIEGKYL